LALAVRSADVEVVRIWSREAWILTRSALAARRVGFARYDLPTTEYLISKGLKPAPDLLITCRRLATRDAGCALDGVGDRREREQRGPVWQNPPADRRHFRGSGCRHSETAARARRRSETCGRRKVSRRSIGRHTKAMRQRSRFSSSTAQNAAMVRVSRNCSRRKGGIVGPRISMTRSVARLLDAAPGFREKANCISCHHNAMPALACGNRQTEGHRCGSRARPQESR